MARLTRYTQTIFGSTAGSNQIAKFGSYANNTPTRYSGTTINPAIIQTLSQYAGGWFSAVLGTYDPAIEDRNALDYLFSYQLSYLLQAGIAEWDSGTTYYTNDRVSYNGIVYRSAIDSNVNNTPATGSSNWTTSSNPIVAVNPGSAVGWFFSVSSGFTGINPGDVYSNNGNNYTLFSALNGTGVWCVTNTAAPQTSGTLARVSGTGTASLTFIYALSVLSFNTPTNATGLQFQLVAGGGGGAGSGTTGTAGNGGNGRASTLIDINKTNYVFCGAGTGATADTSGGPGSGNGVALNTQGTYSYALGNISNGTSSVGQGFNWVNTTGYFCGGNGGNSSFPNGQGGQGGRPSTSGLSGGVGRSGGGGGGASNNPSVAGVITGSGGGAGAYLSYIITGSDLAATYYWAKGTGGTAGTAGTSGQTGGAGGDGILVTTYSFY